MPWATLGTILWLFLHMSDINCPQSLNREKGAEVGNVSEIDVSQKPVISMESSGIENPMQMSAAEMEQMLDDVTNISDLITFPDEQFDNTDNKAAENSEVIAIPDPENLTDNHVWPPLELFPPGKLYYLASLASH